MLASGKTEPPLPALHPHMATIFRERVEQLAAALNQEDELQREQARSIIRSLIERIEIPAEGLLVVRGNLGKMLTAADGAAAVGYVGCGGVQPAVLAVVERGGLNTATDTISATALRW